MWEADPARERAERNSSHEHATNPAARPDGGVSVASTPQCRVSALAPSPLVGAVVVGVVVVAAVVLCPRSREEGMHGLNPRSVAVVF